MRSRIQSAVEKALAVPGGAKFGLLLERRATKKESEEASQKPVGDTVPRRVTPVSNFATFFLLLPRHTQPHSSRIGKLGDTCSTLCAGQLAPLGPLSGATARGKRPTESGAALVRKRACHNADIAVYVRVLREESVC